MDIGLSWTEMLIIGVVAIIVVGPKDLPQLLRTVGQWVGRMKRMARDFQRQLDQAIRDEELDKLRKEVADLQKSTTADMNRALNPIPDRHVPQRAASVERVRQPAPEMMPLDTAAPAAPRPLSPEALSGSENTAASVELPALTEPAGSAGARR